MHLFLRAIGFSTYKSSTQESKLIRNAIKDALELGQIQYNSDLQTGFIMHPFGDGFGICIKGAYNGTGKFKMDYYFPYLISDCKSNVEELTIERHADKESYAIVCDEVKAGVTLIFFLQNIFDYYKYGKDIVCGRSIYLSALSLKGTIILPVNKNDQQIKKLKKDSFVRNNLIAAAKNGDEEAMENLTIDDIDTITQLNRRITNEDIYSIVDTAFMPCGVECDQYAVVGEISDYELKTNTLTNETIYVLTLDCNDIPLKVAINSKDLLGEPSVGRRFKGAVWISGHVNFE